MYPFYVIKKQSVHIQKKTHILLTSKSFTMRGASDSCMGLAWRWCGASVFCGRTKRTKQTSHHPTIFARMIGGWICLYSRNAVFYIMDDVIMDDATCLWGTSIWYVVSCILTSPDHKREVSSVLECSSRANGPCKSPNLEPIKSISMVLDSLLNREGFK